MKVIRNILFFDGDCYFCSKLVDFFYVRNKNRSIFYSSLQSDFASSFLPDEYTSVAEFTTLYYYKGGEIYKNSTAVLMALKELSGVYRYFHYLSIVPLFIRDTIYDLVSRNRHRFNAKSNSCKTIVAMDRSFYLKEELDEMLLYFGRL